MLLFAWGFCSFIVIPHGSFTLMGGLPWRCAGVRSLPVHQQKNVFAHHQGIATSWVVELPCSFGRLAVGCGLEVQQLACKSLFFIFGGYQMLGAGRGWGLGSVCLSPTFCGRWVWYHWRPRETGGWSSSSTTGLGWFGSNLLPPPADEAEDFSGPGRACAWGIPMSPHHSLPWPVVPARVWWGSRQRSGCLRKAGTPGDKYKIGHSGKGGTCLSINTTVGEDWAVLTSGCCELVGCQVDHGWDKPGAESLDEI